MAVTGTGKSSFRCRHDLVFPRDFFRTRRRWLLPLVSLGTVDGHDGYGTLRGYSPAQPYNCPIGA